MAFSVDVGKIVVDGQAIATIGGVNVGLITNAIAKATAIKRETTLGTPSVGYDLMVGWDMTQTTAPDWLAALAAVLANGQTLTLEGARNTVTLSNVFMSAELDMKFNNKSESIIKIEAIKPGVTNATAGAWISSS